MNERETNSPELEDCSRRSTEPQNSVAVTDVAFTTQHIGKDVRASSLLMRRAVDVISEACFTGDLRASHVSAVARSQSL